MAEVLACPVCGLTAPPFMDETYTCESGHDSAALVYLQVDVPAPEPWHPTYVDVG